MRFRILRRSFYVFFLCCVSSISFLYGQSTRITGTVRDAADKQVLPSVTVFFKGTDIAVKTNLQGRFELSAPGNQSMIELSYIGYKPRTIAVKAGQEQQLDILLTEDSQSLNEVSVHSAKKARYRNKDNPAVELIRQVIAHKANNRLESDSTVEFQQYDWMQFSLSNLSEKFKNKKAFKKYQFLFDEQDSSAMGGKNILPIYLRERLSKHYFRKSPEKTKVITLADKQVKFEEGLVDNNAIGNYFERMYADVDIYANNIVFTNSQFLSPIADSAPAYYKFFITDTLKNQSPQLIELSFIPRLPNALLFEGKIYITLDQKYAVQRAFLKTGKDVNINFVRAMEVDLKFEADTRGKFHLMKSHLLIDFGLGDGKGRGFKGERSVTIKNYLSNQRQPDSIYKGETFEVLPDATSRDQHYWANNRLDTLSKEKLQIYSNIDTLGQMKSFRRMMDIATFFFIGYKNLGPVEIGPLYSFVTFNNLEGLRLKVGGRTTTDFSTRFYLDTYLAYGLKDTQWKYFLSGAYSFNNKSIYKFPQSFLRASYKKDMSIPGQEAVNSIPEDNLASSFRRGINDKFLYNDFYKVEYQQEYLNHFSFNIGFRKWTQSAAANLQFIRNDIDQLQDAGGITSAEFNLRLRYAPYEKFYQGKLFRERTIEKYPVFELNYAAGLKGFLQGGYNYHHLLGSIDKRFYMGQFGRSDFRLEGSYHFGKIPFPLLSIHQANQSYSYKVYAYNLMNFLEFVSDHYVSLNVDHNFNGFILNRIPLLRSLKWREYITFKGLYGGLREQNDPAVSDGLLAFPTDEQGRPATFKLGNTPYIEASVGLGNIFKVLRFDVVRRFNYLDQPNVTKWGLRAKVQFEF